MPPKNTRLSEAAELKQLRAERDRRARERRATDAINQWRQRGHIVCLEAAELCSLPDAEWQPLLRRLATGDRGYSSSDAVNAFEERYTLSPFDRAMREGATLEEAFDRAMTTLH